MEKVIPLLKKDFVEKISQESAFKRNIKCANILIKTLLSSSKNPMPPKTSPPGQDDAKPLPGPSAGMFLKLHILVLNTFRFQQIIL